MRSDRWGQMLLRRNVRRIWPLLSRCLRSLRQVREPVFLSHILADGVTYGHADDLTHFLAHSLRLWWRLRTDHHCCPPPRRRSPIARLRTFTITITMVIAMCVCARLFKPFYAPSIEGSCTY